MITSSPSCHFAAVVTGWLAVSWRESMARKISSKLRPVDIGEVSIRLIFLARSMTKTERTVPVWLAFG